MLRLLTKILVFFFLSFYCSALVQAQQQQLQINKIGLEDGLSSYYIKDIAQDADGYIWIATDYGLNRYDGQRIINYTKEEDDLCSNNLLALCFDKRGRLWIKALDYDNSFCYTIFDPKTEATYSIEEYLNIDFPFDLKQSHISYAANFESILFSVPSTDREDLSYYEYEQGKLELIFKKFDPSIVEAYRYIHIGAKLSTGNYFLWFQPKDKGRSDTPSDLIVILNRAGEIQQIQRIPPGHTGLLNHQINHYEVPFYTYCDQDFVRFIQQKLVYVPFANPRDSIVLNDVRVDLPNALLKSSEALYLLDFDQLSVYNLDGDLLRSAALPFKLNLNQNIIFLDRDQNFWIANDQHLYCLNFKQLLFHQELTEETPAIKCRSIFKTTDSSLLLAALGALYQKKDGDWLQRRNMESPITKELWHNCSSIHQEGDSLWVGLEEGQLLVYHLDDWKVNRYDCAKDNHDLLPKIIWDIHRSASGRLWLGTMHGLFYLDEQQQQLLPFDADRQLDISSSEIWHFHHNEAGTWICTSMGLFLMNLERTKLLKHFSNQKQGAAYLPAMRICHLHEDADGQFWLATKGDGLIRWNPKTGVFKQYTQKANGLSNNTLYAVYGDDFNNLWLPSNRGLMSFNKESELVQLYLEEDGLPHIEFNTISHYQDDHGRLYFGGQNGFIHFHPKNIQQQVKNTPLCISSCYLQKKKSSKLVNIRSELLTHHQILLYPDDKLLRINLALLDYQNPKNHQFSYQIMGYDEGWQYLKNGALQINQLPYGTYKIRLRAKTANSGLWQEYPQQLLLKVIAPFYLQSWFILLMLTLIILSSLLFVRQRINRLIKRKKELERLVSARTAKIEKDKELIEAQAEELKSLDQLKSKFFANISHELRTPLTLILGPLSYLLDEEEDLHQEELHLQLRTMYRNGKSLMSLIEEILDLSKLEANKLELKEEITPLKLFLEQLIEKFQAKCELNNIHLAFNYQFINELHLLLDRKKMEKVVNNFISNALKFSSKGSTIVVDVQTKNKDLLLTVTDTGKGIHPADLPFVFDRFYQAKHGENKREGGTGIGLALVREFAELMQGAAYVESTLGKGSNFYFQIPMKIAQTPIIEQNISTEFEVFEFSEDIYQIGTDYNILVVEDNRDMQNFIVQLLTPKYSNVFRANNGQEGLDFLQNSQDPIHFIISDIMMPELDGMSMVEIIKSQPQWQSTPIIMLTALSTERDKLKALTIGVDDYLVKPFSSAELRVRMQNLLYNYSKRQEIQKEDNELPVDQEALLEKNEKEQERIEKERAWIKELEKIVQQSFSSSIINVEQLAEKVFISKRQLTRRLKKTTGLTPSKFIQSIQLEEARHLLLEGSSLNIREVAFRCGFDNPTTFSTVFKKAFGMSPSAYLKS